MEEPWIPLGQVFEDSPDEARWCKYTYTGIIDVVFGRQCIPTDMPLDLQELTNRGVFCFIFVLRFNRESHTYFKYSNMHILLTM